MTVPVAPHPCQPLVHLLNFDHPHRCIMKSLCCLNLHFPVDIQCGASFYILICCLHILVMCLLRSLTSFLIQSFVFVLLKFENSLYILDYSPLSDIFWQILSPSIYFSPCLFFYTLESHRLFSYVFF